MANLLKSQITQGKSQSYRIKIGDSETTITESIKVSSESGKATSTLINVNTLNIKSYEGGAKITESNYTRYTEGSSALGTQDVDVSASRSQSSASYRDGASTVDSVSMQSSAKVGGHEVSAVQSQSLAQNGAGSLESQTGSAIIAKSKQIPEILKNADVKVEELVLAQRGASVSTGASVWSTEGRVESEYGSSEYAASLLNAEAYASAKATLGTDGFKGSANASASVSAAQVSAAGTRGSLSADISASVLTAEAYASASVRVSKDGIEASLNVGASITVAEINGVLSVGDGNSGVEVGVNATVLSASADAGAKTGYAKNEKTGEYELNAYVSASANAVLAEVSVNGVVSVIGIDLGAEVGVYVGAGVSVKIGVEDGNLVFDISAALGIGVSLKITIGFNGEFLRNISIIISYPGVRYARENPYIKVDTEKLREYARRIERINVRLRNLDAELSSVFWQVSPLDMWRFSWINMLTSGSPTLNQVKEYLNNSAERFESAESKANGYVGG